MFIRYFDTFMRVNYWLNPNFDPLDEMNCAICIAQDPAAWSTGCRYIIVSVEICPTTGRPHLQGYVEFAEKITFSTACRRVPGLETASLVPRRGTRDECRDYCRKPETHLAGPWEYGVWAGGQVRYYLNCIVVCHATALII
jgi:hypothetical protein